jgi:hypothetical protein
MVAEGKITVDQGEKLLDALRDAGPDREPDVYVSAGHDDPGAEILGAIGQAIGLETLPRVVRRVRRAPRARGGRSVDRIVRFASSGVSPQYVRQMHEIFEDITSEELMSLSSMGVKPEYAEHVRDALGDDVGVEEIISLASMGVKIDYVEELKDAFGDDIGVEEIISLSSMGVKPHFVEEIKEAFEDDISVDEIISLSSMGVTAKYIEELHDEGIEVPTVKDVLKNKLDT